MAAVTVGCSTKIGRHFWRVDRVDGNYAHISWNGHRKVVPVVGIELEMATRPDGAAEPRPKKPRAPAKPLDAVAQALADCSEPEQLLKVADLYGVTLDAKKADTFSRLPNFGTKRMYVGNAIRHAQKRSA